MCARAPSGAPSALSHVRRQYWARPPLGCPAAAQLARPAAAHVLDLGVATKWTTNGRIWRATSATRAHMSAAGAPGEYLISRLSGARFARVPGGGRAGPTPGLGGRATEPTKELWLAPPPSSWPNLGPMMKISLARAHLSFGEANFGAKLAR